jgi:hypothetical protein
MPLGTFAARRVSIRCPMRALARTRLSLRAPSPNGTPYREPDGADHDGDEKNSNPRRHALPDVFDVAFPAVRGFGRNELIAHNGIQFAFVARVTIILSSASERELEAS